MEKGKVQGRTHKRHILFFCILAGEYDFFGSFFFSHIARVVDFVSFMRMNRDVLSEKRRDVNLIE